MDAVVWSGRSLDDCSMDRDGEASQVWSLLRIISG